MASSGGRLRLGDDELIEVEVTRPGSGMTLLVGGHSYDVGVIGDEDGFEVDVRGFPHSVGVIDPRRKALRTAGGAGRSIVKTQMPGRIVRPVEEGNEVAKGEPMLVVEAMKRENEIKAPRDGVVKRFAVAPGDLVEAGCARRTRVVRAVCAVRWRAPRLVVVVSFFVLVIQRSRFPRRRGRSVVRP